MVDAARAALPFELTRAQDRTLAQILGDMAKPFPMNRLLQVCLLGAPVSSGAWPGQTRTQYHSSHPDSKTQAVSLHIRHLAVSSLRQTSVIVVVVGTRRVMWAAARQRWRSWR